MVNLFFITKKDVGIKEKHKMRLAMGYLVLFSYGVSSRPFPVEAAWP